MLFYYFHFRKSFWQRQVKYLGNVPVWYSQARQLERGEFHIAWIWSSSVWIMLSDTWWDFWGCRVQSQKLDWTIFQCVFQVRIFFDSIIYLCLLYETHHWVLSIFRDFSVWPANFSGSSRNTFLLRGSPFTKVGVQLSNVSVNTKRCLTNWVC